MRRLVGDSYSAEEAAESDESVYFKERHFLGSATILAWKRNASSYNPERLTVMPRVWPLRETSLHVAAVVPVQKRKRIWSLLTGRVHCSALCFHALPILPSKCWRSVEKILSYL